MKLPAGKVIITASLNGAFVTKDMNPSVPERARSPRPCVYWSGFWALIRAVSIWSWPMRSTLPRPCSTSFWRAANMC